MLFVRSDIRLRGREQEKQEVEPKKGDPPSLYPYTPLSLASMVRFPLSPDFLDSQKSNQTNLAEIVGGRGPGGRHILLCNRPNGYWL